MPPEQVCEVAEVADVAALVAIDDPGPDRTLIAQLRSVADLAAALCGVPAAQVNFFDERDQHLVIGHGMPTGPRHVEDSLCHVVRDEPGSVVVPDLQRDPRFVGNPYVDGRLMRARFYASHPLRTPSGRIVGRLCVIDLVARDVGALDASRLASLPAVAERVTEILQLATRNRELARSLDRADGLRHELEASQERLAAFAGQVSHDLKAPLAGVATSLEMLRDQLEETRATGAPLDLEDARWLADKGLRGANRMAVLVDDVLAYALVGGAGQHAQVDLGVVVGDVLDDLSGELDGADVEVGVLPVVRGEHTQLRSLVQNLLGNAAKFRHPPRRLGVSLTCERRGGSWLVEITDNGRGVRADRLTWVFEPLARGDETVPGSGIGLATCQRIVEAHGGDIGLRSRAGEGTTAWFTLPG